MRYHPLVPVAILVLPCVLAAQGFDDSDGAVLAKPLEPRAYSSFAAPSAPSPSGFEPVVRPAPAQPLPPSAAPAAHAPMPRVELPAYATAPKTPSDRKAYALWKGEVTAPPEAANEGFGLSGEERLADAVASPAARPDPSDQLFVSVDVDLKDGAELKDAVADLSRGAGFRADLRFPATRSQSEKNRVSLWGWMPGSGLGAALQIPGVRRVSSSSASRATPGRATSEMLIGLRMHDGPGAAEAVNQARQDLSSRAGVVWRRTIGYQAVPGSKDLAVIFLAYVPLRALSRVLGHPDVLKIQAPPADALPEGRRDGRLPPSATPQPKEPVVERFVKFAAVDSPGLFILTIMLMASAVLGLARRGSRVHRRARVGAR